MPDGPASVMDWCRWTARVVIKAPIHVYRWTLKPYVGWQCRHLPTCSEYGLEAIDRNGAWRGGWLTVSRLCRCRPGGTDGFDPVPDIRDAHHRFAPWRYGRWRRVAIHLDAPSSVVPKVAPATDDDTGSRSI